MKHFYAHLSGDQKNDVSVAASKNGSIQGHIRTYAHGIFVAVTHIDGYDTFHIYQTTGTSGDRKGTPMDLIHTLEVPSHK